jgi:hypothetical protein
MNSVWLIILRSFRPSVPELKLDLVPPKLHAWRPVAAERNARPGTVHDFNPASDYLPAFAADFNLDRLALSPLQNQPAHV